MAFKTAGSTTHYTIQYDDSLSQADGLDRANGLLAKCEADFSLMAGWFAGVTLTVGTPITVQITPGPYARAGWGPPITLVPGNGSPVALLRYLLVSEVVEMFMLAQSKGWFGTGNEGSAGEGLSRFLGAQFLAAAGLGTSESGFDVARLWLNSPRQDYVNHINLLDHAPDATTGCSTLFIYYLHSQLGFSINAIIAAAAPTLAGVYQNLTGDACDPFPNFKQTLDAAFPSTNPDGSPKTSVVPGANPDNPFPLPPFVATKAPALCAFNSKLYAAWKGETSDDRLFYSHFDGSTWAAQTTIAGNSSVGPSLAVLGTSLYAAWKGEHSDERLFFASLAGAAWSAQAQIPGVFSGIGPSLATFNGKLYAAWKGMDNDQGIWYASFDGAHWSSQARIAGVGTSVGPALAAFGGKLYAAWKGLGSDQGIWYAAFDGTQWSAQTNISGVGSSIGPSLAVFNGKLYGAWRGMNNDEGIWYAAFDGTHWSAQAQIPGVASSVGPALAVFNTKLYAMWKGSDGNQQLWYSAFDGTQWSPQANIPGNSGPDFWS